MGVICQFRSTQTGLYYNSAPVPGNMASIKSAATTALTIQNVGAEIGVFGSKYLDKANAGAARSPQWPGFQNTPSGAAFAFLIRIIPRFTGAPTASDMVAMQANNPNRGGLLDFVQLATGAFRFTYIDGDGQTGAQSMTTTATKTNYVSGTAVDLMFSWDGTTSANAVNFGVDGVLFEQRTAPAVAYTIAQALRSGITIGNNANSALGNYDVNELVIFDNAQSVVYATRTDFWPVSAFDASINVSAGAGNIKNGNTTEVIAGVTTTGTYVPAAGGSFPFVS